MVDREKISAGNLIFLGFSLLYLPQLLLALVTTLDTKYSSLTILRNHPSLVMLPVFTFFTFSKQHNFCRSDTSDNRVMFSLKYTKINLAISMVSFALFNYVWRFSLRTESELFHQGYYYLLTYSAIYLFVASVILTITFIYFDYLFCCCCPCFLSSKQQIVVHDPNQPDRTFHLVDGEIIEVYEKAEGLRSIFIQMNIRDAVTSFSNNLNLSSPDPSVVTPNVSQ